MTASPDGDLVLAYSREGSEAAFRALVTRHVNLVYGTALRQVGDAGIAEEISQNVFVALAKKAPRLSGNQTLAGWLHRTTLLEAKARIRAELRQKRRDQTAAELAIAAREGGSAADALAPLLDEGLLNLREADRMALVLRFLEQRSLREVGAMMGVDEDAARKRVARALEKLTQFFRKRGFAVTASLVATLESAGQAAAPAGLIISATQAGVTATAASGGTSSLITLLNSATHAKVAVACALVAAVPLALQWRANAKVQYEHSTAADQLRAAQVEAENLESQINVARQFAIHAQTENANLGIRLASIRDQSDRRTPAPAYRWDDHSPVFRLPKAALAHLDVSVFRNRRGALTPAIKEILQLTPAEATRIETALAGFLARYHAAETPNIRQVSPTADDLQGHAKDETRVFEITAIGEPLKQLRAELLAELNETLGPERFAIFQEGLSEWMPLDDAYHGMNSVNTVFNSDRRLRFYKPRTPHLYEDLEYSVYQKGRGLMNIRMSIDEIPPGIRPHLEDWIRLARELAARKGNLDE